jgi:Ser/Thr protein kinase RdoA (MazF antagonist)
MYPTDVEITVRQCLSENYGLDGTLTRLSGENLNYLLTLKSGDRLVVKIVDDDMPAEVVEMESAALKHAVSSGFRLKLPEIIENLDRKIETGIIIRTNQSERLRVIEYIKGNELESIPDISKKILKNVGKIVAEFDQAMLGFSHPAAYRSHRWNLAETGQHLDKVSLVNDLEKRALLQWGFDQWLRIEYMLHGLPWQYIHGDLNRENILVDKDRICGLVDFGDSCMNPTVCDLAIALTYFMMEQDDPLEPARFLMDGYEEIRVLEAPERFVLIPLVCGRLAVSISISHQRKLIDPENPNWFSSEQPAWRLLGQLRRLVREGRGFE